ncbi:helix-turn-helix domain-containing protein [Streptomyces vinaceus]
MGRPELPVDETVRERALLAKALRRIRRKARLSYDELAAKTGLSAATLKRAASGKTVPSEDTVKTIATACGQDPEILHWYWRDARIADRGRLAQLRKPALPQFINGRRELSAALEYFYEDAGAPPLRRLTELAGGAHLLPVSSAARIVSRQALPASRQQMIAFLTACGHPGHLMGLWGDAFEEITRGSDVGRMPSVIDGSYVPYEQGGRPVRVALQYMPPVVERRGDRRMVTPPEGWLISSTELERRGATRLLSTEGWPVGTIEVIGNSIS